GGVQALALVPQGHPKERLEMDTSVEERAAMVEYFSQMGVAFNPETEMAKRACLAYKRGETRGPAISDEYPSTTPDGRPSVRQRFSAGILEAFQDDAGTWQANWMELCLHPEAITG